MKQLLSKTRLAALSLVAGAALTTGVLFNESVLGQDRQTTWDAVAPKVNVSNESVAAVQAISDTFAQIAQSVSPAVVFIQVEKEARGIPAGFDGQGMQIPEEFFRRFFGPNMPNMPDMEQRGQGMPRGPVPVGQGSGFIISSDGYIVTNHHVAGDADRLRVTLSDGREFQAELIGSDPATEIALIKIDGKNLPVAPLGNSDSLRVGEWVLAIGSPFGLDMSVTSGIVSASGRGNVGIVDYADFIQTDAAINPGNSGGPLLNMRGEVVAVNTAIMSRTGGNNGIGFSIPINMVKYVVDELREHGTVSRGFLGVGIQQVTPDLAKWFNLEDGHGVLVSSIQPGSPAEKAGIQRDDIILSFNGQTLSEIGSFRSRVSITPAGTEVPLVVLRDGERVELKVTLGTLEQDEMVARADGSDSPIAEGDYGLAVQNLTNDIASRLGFADESGVVIADVQPGSAAERAGLKPGQLIKEVNKQKINNTREYESALKEMKNDTVLLLVQEEDGQRYVALSVA